jgi:predicted ATPase
MTGSVAFVPHLLALSAEVQARSSQTKSSLRTLDEALGLCDRNDERYYEPEIHRLRGELLLRPELSDHVAAEEALRRAIEISRAQQSRMFELRSAVSLGRLLRHQGRGVEAREMLSALYGWFSEGLDTPDLRDASELLAELAQPRPVRA